MVIANLSSTISLQFPVLLFSAVWSRSSLFCSCLLAGAPPSVAPLSGCLQEQRRDVTLRPSPIRLGPSSSSQIHFMMEIAPICVQQHLCTPHVDHRISITYFWLIFSGERAFVPVESRREISAGWGMMYGSRVPADADNTVLEYHPERSLETSPSRPETSQLWYGHYGNLCALDAFCVPAPVIETAVMHETLQMERGTINIFGGFKFLMARKSPQYILGCVWCVSMVPCIEQCWGRDGLAADTWYRDSEPSTIHPMSPFCQHHRQKFVLERTGQQLLKILLRQEFQF